MCFWGGQRACRSFNWHGSVPNDGWMVWWRDSMCLLQSLWRPSAGAMGYSLGCVFVHTWVLLLCAFLCVHWDMKLLRQPTLRNFGAQISFLIAIKPGLHSLCDVLFCFLGVFCNSDAAVSDQDWQVSRFLLPVGSDR